jgi:hypothetical protein
LIKAKVEENKRIPGYAKAFDEHLSTQDNSKHASKAVSERKEKTELKELNNVLDLLLEKLVESKVLKPPLLQGPLLG